MNKPEEVFVTSFRLKVLFVLTVMGLSLIPAFYLKISQWVNGELIDDSLSNLAIEIGQYCVIAISLSGIIASVIIALVDLISTKISWEHNPYIRAAVEFTLSCSTTVAITFIYLQLLIYVFPGIDYNGSVETADVLFIAVMMNLILLPISEGIIFLNGWVQLNDEKKKLLLLNEQMEKEQVIAQYETLKNQINPHFLFNSLNVLSSLVHEDVNKAEEFIEEFASIYRYVLETSENDLVPLQREVDFAESYLFLQKIRFGDNLRVDFNINGPIDKIVIIPLSLEVLVENCIKHNKISSQAPLHISIYMEDNFIVVKNNLQERNEKVNSTGIGLKNITERYWLYNQSKVITEQTNETFIAKVPLIKS